MRDCFYSFFNREQIKKNAFWSIGIFWISGFGGAVDLQDRADRALRADARRTEQRKGMLMDPAERRRGVPRGNKPGGRPRGVKRSYDKRKPLAAPSLRRDPTCQKRPVVTLEVSSNT